VQRQQTLQPLTFRNSSSTRLQPFVCRPMAPATQPSVHRGRTSGSMRSSQSTLKKWRRSSRLCRTSSVALIRCRPGCWRSASQSWRRSSTDCSMRLCVLAVYRSRSSRCTLCLCLKWPVSITSTQRITDPSPICRSFPRCWNASLSSGYSSISSSTVCSPACSLPTGNVIRRRPW